MRMAQKTFRGGTDRNEKGIGTFCPIIMRLVVLLSGFTLIRFKQRWSLLIGIAGFI